MNGECKSYRLNSPMTWQEFRSMPDDIKVTYIKLLREKFSCPDSKIGEMMGASKDQVSLMFKKLGLNQGKTKKEGQLEQGSLLCLGKWCGHASHPGSYGRTY